MFVQVTIINILENTKLRFINTLACILHDTNYQTIAQQYNMIVSDDVVSLRSKNHDEYYAYSEQL